MARHTATRHAAVMAALALAVGGCGSTDPDSTGEASAATAAAPADWATVPLHPDAEPGDGYLIDDSSASDPDAQLGGFWDNFHRDHRDAGWWRTIERVRLADDTAGPASGMVRDFNEDWGIANLRVTITTGLDAGVDGPAGQTVSAAALELCRAVRDAVPDGAEHPVDVTVFGLDVVTGEVRVDGRTEPDLPAVRSVAHVEDGACQSVRGTPSSTESMFEYDEFRPYR